MVASRFVVRGVVGLCGSSLAILASSCGQPGTLRQNEISQDQASIQAKFKELAPAEGVFTGSVTLDGSGQAFDATITIKRTMETQRDPQSDDPSDTVSLPTLTGSLRFPAIDNLQPADYPGFHALLDPMGGYATVLFDLGDYDPSTQQLVLPYTVPGYSSGNFGELTGTLTNGTYQGDWFCKPLGDTATFSFQLQTSGQSQ